jgi:outer membrane protein assembly factor BamB
MGHTLSKLLIAGVCFLASQAIPAAPAPEWIDGVRFAFRADAPIRGTPAVQDGALFVGSSDGVFHAIDAKTGIERWRLRTGGAITSSPAAAQGRVFFASRDGSLYAVDAKAGRVLWSHRFGPDLGSQNYWDYYLSSPILADGSLFIGSGDGHLYAFDAATGRVRWRQDAGSRIRATAAVRDGLVVYGTMGGRVCAVNQADGAPRWCFATEGAAHRFEDAGNDTTSVFASPTIAGGLVAVGGRDGFLYALDLATGRQVWRTTHDGSSWILSTAFDGESLYVGSGSALIVQAADPATGAERWRFATRGAVFGSLAVAGDSVVFSDFTGTLYAIDKRNGALRWQFGMGGRALSAPVVADGVVYAASDNGVLFALDIAKAAPRASARQRRIVYREGLKSATAFAWFKNDIDVAILDHLKGTGYETMDAAQLEAFLREQLVSAVPSVVVFADNKIPDRLADESAGKALILRYLDAGGKVALLGPNPLAYRADATTGQVTEIDFALPARVFGVAFPDQRLVGGYYASAPTAAGRHMGLRSGSVSYLAIDAAINREVTVLALDEYGKASAWLRPYGGRPGTGLLQLSVPRQDLVDLSEYQAAIEFGVAW